MKKVLHAIRRFYYTSRVKRVVLKYGKNLRVNAKSTMSSNVELGNNVNFNGMHILGNGKVLIGDNFHSGSECMIITQNHNYEGCAIPYDNSYIYKTIRIKDNVWLGNRVIITGNTTIGEGAIVAAGSVVCKDVPDFAIVGGNPARVIKYRDINHYLELKTMNKIH